MLPALPSQYLQRLRLQNSTFADDIRFEGLLNVGGFNWSIVTSQPDVSGTAASLLEIESAMGELGFTSLPWRGVGYDDSLAFRKDHLCIWDCHSGNFVLTPTKVVVPIDVIITICPFVGISW